MRAFERDQGIIEEHWGCGECDCTFLYEQEAQDCCNEVPCHCGCHKLSHLEMTPEEREIQKKWLNKICRIKTEKKKESSRRNAILAVEAHKKYALQRKEKKIV